MPPFQETPRCLSPFQRNLFSLHCLDFHAEDRLPPRWNVGQPCRKASCESFKGKPQIIYSRDGKRDTAATALEKSARACPHSRRGLSPLGDFRSTPRSMSALERNPHVPSPTPHKVLGPGIDGRGIPRGPRELACGLAFPEATRAGPCGRRHKSRAPAATRENPGGFALQAR